jgi:chromosome segregation ATPase
MTGQTGRRWLAVAVVIGAVTNVSGQSAAPPRQDDVLGALLAEVRGLRAAMEQMASAGPRVQLFVGRLQLQEARLNGMIRRLDAVRDSLASAQADLARSQGQQRQFEAAMEEHRLSGTPEAREEARQAEAMIGEVKRQTAAAKATVDRYTAEEAQLTQDITTEQARWLDINQRLDELEKTLSRK